MKVPKLFSDASAQPQRRRRRRPRSSAPTSLLPLPEEDALADDGPAAGPLAADLDAARRRLRQQLPPLSDED